MAKSAYVIETTAERFEADVFERSKQTPVVLDFWAAWCQPCRLLAPLLEKLAEEYAGKFFLVKADTDQLPQQAMAFAVEGIPAVYALRDGEVVDSFTGLLTESQLRQWLAAIVPSEAEILVKEAADLEASDAAAAEKKYRRALELSPLLPAATFGLIRVLIATGKPDEARKLLEQLEGRGFLEPEAQRLKAKLQLRGGARSADDLNALRAAVALNPTDSAAKLQLATALLAMSNYEEGLRHCLDVVTRERGPLRDEARQRMLDAFRVLGDDSPLTSDFRRQLAMALY
jgi:putative thioredoxin